jgi:hypothetical protein
MDINELVRNHFFNCDKKASVNSGEHYYEDNNGISLYNSKYNVIFPHDVYSEENINKYIRRFERLKNLILTSDDKLCFLYTSQSSLNNGHFTINGNNVLNDIYFYLSKIYKLIGNYNNNYTMVAFDTIRNENRQLLNENIILCEINEGNNWTELLPQMNYYVHIFT